MKNRCRLVAVAALAAAAALLLSNCPQNTGTASRLSSEKTFTSLVFSQSSNPSLSKNYSAKWRADKDAWYFGTLPYGSDLDSAVATFTLSSGASAAVNGVAQISGITPNNYNSAVVYTLTAEDGSTTEQKVLADTAAAPTTPANNVTVRFGSWNLNDCDKDDGTARYTQIAAAIKAAGIKVLACCETQLEGDTGADISNLQSALSAIGWALPYCAGVRVGAYGTEQPDDLAVLSAFPFEDEGISVVSPTVFYGSYKWPRPMLKATLTIDTRTVTVFVGHLKASSYSDDENTANLNVAKRRAEAKALAEYIRSNFDPASDIVLIAGDMNTVSPGDRADAGSTFNSTYTSLAEPTLSYLQLKDDDSTNTSNNFKAMNESLLPSTSTHESGGILDHIILSPAAQSIYIDSSVKVSVPAQDCSDHYPVSLELQL